MEDIPTIVAISVDDFLDAAKTLNLKAVPKARINLAVNVARIKAGMPPIDMFTQVPEEATAAQMTRIEPAGRPEEATVTKVTLKVAHYCDQGCRLEVKPCTEDEILKLRAEWTSKMWLAPTADLDLTNNQLSVLKRLKEAGHNMLAFDMGVWAPWGGRRERRFMLMAHVRNTEGEWVAKEEPGAQNIEDWTTGWEFASVGFVMARIIEKGVADAYKAHFTRLANLYPQAWWIAYRAEWQLRHEWAVAEHHRQKAFYHEQPELSKYYPDMPWNTVLLAAIRGVESMQYWETEYKDQARMWMETRRTPTYSTPAQIINPPGSVNDR